MSFQKWIHLIVSIQGGLLTDMDPYEEYLKDDHQFTDTFQGASKQLGRYLMIKLGSASLGYPFELARLLRQCQTKVTVEPESKPSPILFEIEEKSLEDKLKEAHTIEDNIKSYSLSTDSAGYVKPTELALTSRWPMIIDKKHGIGQTSLFIARRQGLSTVWNGLIPYWCHRVCFDLGKATLEESLESSDQLLDTIDTYIPVYKNRIDLKPSVIPIIAQAVSGFLTSPFELIQTRLAVQSVYHNEQAYSGTFDAAKKIYKEEGGISGFFPCPILTLLTKTLEPFLRIVPHLLFSQLFEETYSEDTILSRLALLLGHFTLIL